MNRDRRAGEANAEALARLEKLSRVVPGVLYQYRLRPNGGSCFPYASDAIRDVFRVSPEEVREDASVVLARIHPDDAGQVSASIQASARDLTPWRQEFRLKFDNGTVRWMLGDAIPEREPDGSVLWHGFTTDITDKKRADETLEENASRWAFAIEGTGTGVLDWDIPTGQMHFSPRWLALAGYTRDELPPKLETLTSLVHPDDLPMALADVQAVLEGRKAVHAVEHRLKHKSGQWIWIEARSLVSARNERGEPVRMIGTHVDITARKRAAEERARLENQLHQAQKVESVGRLAGGVAHDFNNMLSVILGHVGLALERLDPAEPLYADLKEVQAAAERSADLTRQLLAFARKQMISPRVLDLNETVAGMLKMLRRLIGEQIRLDWRPDPAAWPVRMDPSQLDQVLANLCVNARDAIAGVGTLTIETGNCAFDEAYCAAHEGFEPGEYVWLTVSDTGSGMNQETVSHLFEPFFTTKVMGKGTGLGLSTVYGAVKQNHGFITVSSEPGTGTTFTIYLPRSTGTVGGARSAASTSDAPRGHERLLVVEDELVTLKMITRMLERHGYFVLAASTPAEALRLAREHAAELHLLMTDVIMPEMNGLELASAVSAIIPGIKRLFMSGYTADVIAHHGVLEEEVHFIHKPFSMEELGAEVRAALAGK